MYLWRFASQRGEMTAGNSQPSPNESGLYYCATEECDNLKQIGFARKILPCHELLTDYYNKRHVRNLSQFNIHNC